MAPRTTVLSDQVYEQILELLLKLEISPNQRINIDQLSAVLGVSQTPVREALSRLESDGLVNKVPLKGYRVTPLLGQGEIRDLIRFIAILVPEAASLAVLSISEEEKNKLLVAASNFSRRNPEPGLHKILNSLNLMFETILELSGSRLMLGSFKSSNFYFHLSRLVLTGENLGFEPTLDDNFFQSLNRIEGQLKHISDVDPSEAKQLISAWVSDALVPFEAIGSLLNLSEEKDRT